MRLILILIAFALLLSFSQGYCEKKAAFELVATVIDPELSFQSRCVILDLNTGEEHSCRTGDRVVGYQVVMITRGSATLLKDGEYLFLNLPFGNENKPQAEETGFIKVQRGFLDRRINDLNMFINSGVLPVPYVEGGKVVGLSFPESGNKIYEILLSTAGLKEGDIATSINGEPIDSVKKAIELYSKFKDQSRIELQIKRGDSFKSLNYLLN
jgi:hypothetical protein